MIEGMYLAGEVRLNLRALRRNPGFTITASPFLASQSAPMPRSFR
jgi:hypothetical protein